MPPDPIPPSPAHRVRRRRTRRWRVVLVALNSIVTILGVLALIFFIVLMDHAIVAFGRIAPASNARVALVVIAVFAAGAVFGWIVRGWRADQK